MERPTIGMVLVASITATTARGLQTAMTSTPRLTRSRAMAGNCSDLAPA